MAIIKRPPELTVSRIQYHLSNWFHTRYDMMVPNAFIGDNELDFVGVRKSGSVDEFEIKMTRSDFFADFKKTCRQGEKHIALMAGELTTNFFTFVTPDGLIELSEIPKQYGLIAITERGCVRELQKASRLHSGKISDQMKLKLAMKLYYRWWESFRASHR